MKNEKLGTIIHGIGASEHLDSSGERLIVKGIDISSLDKTGTINTEHKSESTTQIIGKIIEAKKIENEDDCDNEHHKYFFKKADETPYLYIKAVLFDKFGHSGAVDAAAMLKFDKKLDKTDTKQLIGFSIEGNKLDKEGGTIKTSIARRISLTLSPCNKVCVAEILEPTNEKEEDAIITVGDLKIAFKKAMDEQDELQKAEKKYSLGLSHKLDKTPKPNSKVNYTPISSHVLPDDVSPGLPIIPERTIPASEVKETENMVGKRILHERTPKMRSGAAIYNDPKTWEKDPRDRYAKPATPRWKVIQNMKQDNLTKDTLTDNIETKPENNLQRIKQELQNLGPKIMKKISEDMFDLYKHKGKLIDFIGKKYPDMDKNDVEALAKTYVLYQTKKEENKLKKLMEEIEKE